MKDVIKRFGLIVAVSVITYGLMAVPAKKQQQRVTLTLSVPEVDLILKALSELPLKESGNLYIGIQQQANSQLNPPQKPKADTSAGKTKKP
jgi:hypothetical protein